MKSSTQDKVEGMFLRIKGKLKETAGELSDNPTLEAEGAGKVACDVANMDVITIRINSVY